MNQVNRIRTLWALVALAAIYGLGAVIVYYLAGFGPIAFSVSLFVYSFILVAALLVAASDLTGDPGEDQDRAAVAVSGTSGSADTRMRVVHEDGKRRILRSDSGSPDREADFLVVDGDQVRPLSEIEEELDAEPAPSKNRKEAEAAVA